MHDTIQDCRASLSAPPSRFQRIRCDCPAVRVSIKLVSRVLNRARSTSESMRAIAPREMSRMARISDPSAVCTVESCRILVYSLS